MALTFSWRQLANRIAIHMNNNYPDEDYTVTDNQMLLYINEAMSFGLVGQVWNGAKVMGTMEVPEAYILQFKLPALTQDTVSGNWITTLPQPPLSLPLGYSINRIYPANSSNGVGQDVIFLKAKRIGRRKNMPLQFGVYGKINGQQLSLEASNGTSLLNQDFYAEMPSTRATDIDDPMNLPDDATDLIFTKVVARLKERIGLPQDIVLDGEPAGNKAS